MLIFILISDIEEVDYFKKCMKQLRPLSAFQIQENISDYLNSQEMIKKNPDLAVIIVAQDRSGEISVTIDGEMRCSEILYGLKLIEADMMKRE